MEAKYFMHRIKKENGSYSKGIEVHDTLESAVGSFHSYMKVGYNNPNYPNVTYVACKVTDVNGNVVGDYDEVWPKNDKEPNVFFLHHIRKTNDTFSKDIDVLATFDAARSSYHDQMAYGYDNPRQPDVNYVACMITDLSGTILTPFKGYWIRPEAQPEPESEAPNTEPGEPGAEPEWAQE